MQTRRTTLPLLLLLLLAASGAHAQNTDAAQAVNEKLWEAARTGDAAAVRTLLDRGADVNAKFRYGQTALFKAAERGHAEVVKILLERGADANVKDTFYGETALGWALEKGHFEVVRALLTGGAQEVEKVLMAGVRRGDAELTGVALTRGGLKPETLTLALAAAQSDEPKPAVVELLKKAGAAPPPEIPEATLQSYAGGYKSEQGTVFNVSVKDGKLFAAPADQQPRVLMPLDRTSFRPVFREGVLFSFRVEGDKVTGFDLKQGQSTTLFKKQ